MGQKIHPKLFRLGQTSTWGSRWFDMKNYHTYLLQDYRIRETINARFPKSGILLPFLFPRFFLSTKMPVLFL